MQLVCNLLPFRICQAMSIALESILKSWTTGCLVWTKFLFNCSCHRVASRHQAEVTRDPQDVCCIIEASHDQFYPEKCQWQPPKCYAMILVTMIHNGHVRQWNMLNFFQTVLPRKPVFFKTNPTKMDQTDQGAQLVRPCFGNVPFLVSFCVVFWLAVYCILHINCADMAFDLHLNMCNVPRKHPQLPPPKLHRRWPKKPRQIARPQIAWQNGRVKGVNKGPLVDRISTQWAR